MTPKFASLILILSALAACTQQQPSAEPYAQRPAFYVPSTAIIYPTVAAADTPNPAWQLLPTSEAEYFAVGRPEKFLYGSTPLSAYSAFTIYTYDYQKISTPRGGWGYRQTYSVRTGESVP